MERRSVIAIGKNQMYLVGEIDTDGYSKESGQHMSIAFPTDMEIKEINGESVYCFEVNPDYDSLEGMQEFYPGATIVN